MGKSITAKIESELTAVESIVKLLLDKQFEGQYQVQISGEHHAKQLQIHADEAVLKTIQQALRDALASSAAIRQLVGYQLTSPAHTQTSSLPIDYDDIPAMPEETVASGLAMLTNLLPSEIGDGFIFRPADIFKEDKGAHVKEGVLYSQETKKSRTKQQWDLCTEAMLELFTDEHVDRLREALQTGRSLENRTSEDSNDDSESKIAKGLLLECFGTVDNQETGGKRIYFNYAKLFQLLYPPKLDIDESYLSIDLPHLTMYMKQLVSEGFLLTISDDQNSAHPIFWEGLSTIAKPLNLFFTLDTSGSMYGEEAAMRSHIQDVLTQLRATIPAEHQARTNVTFQTFNSQVGPKSQHKLTDMIGIESFLNAIYCDGGTKLYAAVKSGLMDLADAKDKNNVMIILTDGQDNDNKQDIYDAMIAKLNTVTADNDLALSVFTLGLGYVNVNVLKTIASTTAAEYFPILNLGEFKQKLLDNIERMTFEHRIVKLLVGAQTFKLPVPRNGSFTQAKVTVPLQQGQAKIQVDADEYIVQLGRAMQLSPSASAGLHGARQSLARAGSSSSQSSATSSAVATQQQVEAELHARNWYPSK